MSEEVKVETPKETLSQVDHMALQLAKSRKETVLAQAEKALAQNEAAELAFKNIVLQLYMKYGLTQEDAINEQGEILRGGAAEAMKQQGK